MLLLHRDGAADVAHDRIVGRGRRSRQRRRIAEQWLRLRRWMLRMLKRLVRMVVDQHRLRRRTAQRRQRLVDDLLRALCLLLLLL